MKTRAIRLACLAATAAFLVGGCASTQAPKESGFLKDYSNLTKQDAPGGGSRLVYKNPAFTPGKYTSVMLDPVVFYPEPQPTEQVSMQALNEIRTYVDRSLQQKFGQQVRLVNQPGPGVARIQVALTAVGTESQALKVYQYIPIALVVTGAKAAIEGGRPQDASIAIESRVTDSETGQLLYASVRGGTGEQIKTATQGQGGVQLTSLKPLIDTWTTGAAAEAGRYIGAK
jgi:hypothetical protein